MAVAALSLQNAKLLSCRICIFIKQQFSVSWAVVAHAFNPSTWEAEAGGSPSSEFEASLVYRASSRTARATQKGKKKVV